MKSLPRSDWRYLGSCSGARCSPPRGLGDLAQQGAVGGGVFQLAVVLVDDEPGAVAADLLAVAGRDGRHPVIARRGLVGDEAPRYSSPFLNTSTGSEYLAFSSPSSVTRVSNFRPGIGAPLASRAVTPKSSVWPEPIRRRVEHELDLVLPLVFLVGEPENHLPPELPVRGRVSSEAPCPDPRLAAEGEHPAAADLRRRP